MYVFSGEFNCKIDNKGRITLPSKLREHLEGTTFVITRGLDKCIDLYPMEQWNEKTKLLATLKTTNKNHRAYMHFILSAATELEFDAQGRINIPQSLKSHATLVKDVVVIGNMNKIEIWSKDVWDEYIKVSIDKMGEITEDIGI